MNQLFSILLVAIGIGFLIFVHELGHYLAARLAGVRVLAFSLGFGPRLFGFRRGGTDYRLSLVPLGGYVRVAGEDPTWRDGLAPDDLHAKGFLARALFFSGGVLMNLLFAIVAFPLVFRAGVEFTAPVLGTVAPGGPAWEARLQPGDRILELDGKPMYSFENMAVEVALSGGATVELLVQRGDERFRAPVRPRWAPAEGWYTIDIASPPDPERPHLVVDPDSPAAAAGLRSGDRLAAIEGQSVDGTNFVRVIQELALQPEQPLRVTVLRDGAEIGPIEFVPATRRDETPRIGVLPARLRVAAIRRGATLAEQLDLRLDDRILTADGKPFGGGSFAALRDGPQTLVLTVQRPGHDAPLELRAPATPEQRAALDDQIGLRPAERGVFVEPTPDSPASRAGIEAGDELLRAGDRELHEWTDLQAAVAANGDRPLSFVVRRAGQERSVTITPERRLLPDPGFTTVGREALRELYRVESLPGAVAAGFVASVDLIKQLYVTLKRLFTGDVAASNLGGIITISRVSYDQAQSGWARFFYFLALLSINLAFINVLPIPVLDGGHLLFLLIERIKGSPVSTRVLNYSQLLGLVFVVALMIYVTFNDIRRLF
jgi:regulator of sigma E protease